MPSGRALGKQKDGFHPEAGGPSVFRLAAPPWPIRCRLAIETRRPATTHYVLTVPVTYKKDDQERTRFARVGAVFENHRRDTG